MFALGAEASCTGNNTIGRAHHSLCFSNTARIARIAMIVTQLLHVCFLVVQIGVFGECNDVLIKKLEDVAQSKEDIEMESQFCR